MYSQTSDCNLSTSLFASVSWIRSSSTPSSRSRSSVLSRRSTSQTSLASRSSKPITFFCASDACDVIDVVAVVAMVVDSNRLAAVMRSMFCMTTSVMSDCRCGLVEGDRKGTNVGVGV